MRKSTFRKMRQEQKEYQLGLEKKGNTAYHEAAHAVMAVLLDFPLEYATVIPYTADGVLIGGLTKMKTENGGKFYLTNNQAWMYLMVQQAPAIVESSRKTHQPGSISGGDAETINRILNAIPEDQRANYIEKASIGLNLMFNDKKVCQAIERVAEMLFENGRVEGEDIRREVMAIAGHRFTSRKSIEALERRMQEDGDQEPLEHGDEEHGGES